MGAGKPENPKVIIVRASNATHANTECCVRSSDARSAPSGTMRLMRTCRSLSAE